MVAASSLVGVLVWVMAKTTEAFEVWLSLVVGIAGGMVLSVWMDRKLKGRQRP